MKSEIRQIIRNINKNLTLRHLLVICAFCTIISALMSIIIVFILLSGAGEIKIFGSVETWSQDW